MLVEDLNEQGAGSSNYWRLEACRSLAVTGGGPNVVAALCEIVRSDSNVVMRRSAATALGRLGDAKAVDALTEMLASSKGGDTTNDGPYRPGMGMTVEDKKRAAREQAAIALGLIPGDKASERAGQGAWRFPGHRARNGHLHAGRTGRQAGGGAGDSRPDG